MDSSQQHFGPLVGKFESNKLSRHQAIFVSFSETKPFPA